MASGVRAALQEFWGEKIFRDKVTFAKGAVRKFSLGSTFEEGKWYAYTPTFTGFGTCTNVNFWWKREGGDVHIRGKFTAGTVTGTEARLSLPLSLVSDSTIITSIDTAGYPILTSAVGGAGISLPLIESGVGYITFGRTWQSGAVISNYTKQLGTGVCGNNSDNSIVLWIPVSGWN